MSDNLPVLAGTEKEADNLTPKDIVRELDKYVIGQKKAKMAVAIALRNRTRRMKLPSEMAEEVAPKNIIMIGPTGVGKTEIARRLSRLTHSPFIKVEASKYTEVGYVGRDCESMVRDLAEIAVQLVKGEQRRRVRSRAERRAEDRLLDLLLPRGRPSDASPDAVAEQESTRDKLRAMLREGRMDEREVEMDVSEQTFPSMQVISAAGVEEMGINLKDMLPGLFGGRKKRRRMKVREAREYILSEEEDRLLDMDAVVREARKRTEESGIVFIDELDKIAGREGAKGAGPDVSREGVQRDILPIVEGTTVTTKYGPVRTDHVLFLAAGAFHIARPSDLIPELQGRFPIRVELDSLTKKDFERILTEPRNALIKQYIALMSTEGLELGFSPDAISEIARIAEAVNERTENIGARRLHTIMEKLLEEISFEGPDLAGQRITIDADYVRRMLDGFVKDEDLSRYIL